MVLFSFSLGLAVPWAYVQIWWNGIWARCHQGSAAGPQQWSRQGVRGPNGSSCSKLSQDNQRPKKARARARLPQLPNAAPFLPPTLSHHALPLPLPWKGQLRDSCISPCAKNKKYCVLALLYERMPIVEMVMVEPYLMVVFCFSK